MDKKALLYKIRRHFTIAADMLRGYLHDRVIWGFLAFLASLFIILLLATTKLELDYEMFFMQWNGFFYIFCYVTCLVVFAHSLPRRLGGGEAYIYLSRPIDRFEYLASRFSGTCALFMLFIFLKFAIDISVAAYLSGVGVEDVVYRGVLAEAICQWLYLVSFGSMVFFLRMLGLRVIFTVLVVIMIEFSFSGLVAILRNHSDNLALKVMGTIGLYLHPTFSMVSANGWLQSDPDLGRLMLKLAYGLGLLLLFFSLSAYRYQVRDLPTGGEG